MFTFDLELSDFERMAKRLGGAADQLPFAMSQTLNAAAEATRHHLIDDVWPSHVTVRRAGFMNAALTIKGERATKQDLSVTIYDRLGHAHLQEHAKGGWHKSRGHTAVPNLRNVRRTGSGVVKSQKPRALVNSFRKGDVIYQRGGGKKAKAKRLKLMFVLKPQTRIRPDVPFYQSFAETMRREILERFPGALAHAMKTRR